MKVLITGGAGFIGSHFVEHFSGGGTEIRVLDNLDTGEPENLAGFNYEMVFGSVLNREAVRAAMAGVDYVFHMAARISVTESLEKPLEYAETNILGTLIVLQEAERAKVNKVIFASSASIYGNQKDGLADPQNPYAITKMTGEFYCRMFCQDHGLPVLSLRFFNVFGPRQGLSSRYAAVPAFIQKCLNNEPITIHGDGKQTRDFIYVRDLVAASVYLGIAPGVTGTFDIGTGEPTSILELVSIIKEITGSESQVVYGSPRLGDIRHSSADLTRLKATGYKPQTRLERDLGITIDSYRIRFFPT